MALAHEIVTLMDHKLALEYREVALRPEHVSASALSGEEIGRLIDLMERAAEGVTVVNQPRPLSTDPSDDMILDVAINGKADAIVTNNAKHFRSAAERFRIRVLSPSELLELWRKGR